MFGKIFASMYTGSMVGAGPYVFSVWPYVIANVQHSVVELNPALLAPIIGVSAADIERAIEILCQPDIRSRCKDHDGARLVYIEAFKYFVVTAEHYRGLRNTSERATYMRDYMRKYMKDKREKEKLNPVKTRLAHTESDTETESHTEIASAVASQALELEPLGAIASQSTAATKPKAKTKAQKKKAERERLEQITRDAMEAWNAILGKPNGLLPSVTMVSFATRVKQVSVSIDTASAICADLFKSRKVTPEFWGVYFNSVRNDPFYSGRKKGGAGHEDFVPDFETILRAKTISKIYERERNKKK